MSKDEKVKDIKEIFEAVGNDPIKKMLCEAFIDGLEKGLKINQSLKSA